MQINAPERIRDAAKVRGKERRGTGAAFAPETAAVGATSHAVPVASVQSLVSVDALLALQGEEPGARRRRAVAQGVELLDVLEEIKIELLEGGLSYARLERLTGLVEQRLEGLEDPCLEAILAEIDLRARVELAKHGRILAA